MTDCSAQTTLPFHPDRPVVLQFDGPVLTSDGGAVLLREVDEQLGLTAGFAACLPDLRDPNRIEHSRHEQARQRIYQIALGYEDCNDADRLRHDPLLKTVCDRLPESGGLSSQPTLSRFENAMKRRAVGRLVRWFENSYVASLSPDQEVVILDIDSTDDATYGQQQLSFFHGYYDHYMFHPLLVYDGDSGELITAILRPGNRHASRGAKGILRRLILKIRRRCPNAAIVVRGDSGFCVPQIVKALERLNSELGGVDYLLGIAKNPRLLRYLEPTLQEAESRQIGQEKCVLYTRFQYAAKSWTHPRCIVAKAEITWRGRNPRFLLTSLGQFEPDMLYRAYCERGRCELWIKDLKNALAADRLSCSSFLANAFRLMLHATAYRLMHALRLSVAKVSQPLGKAQFDTLRLKLLRVAASVKQTVRCIRIRLPKAFPEAAVFHQVARTLARGHSPPA